MYILKGKSVKTFVDGNLQIEGFTGNKIWSKPIAEVFPTSPAEGFLQMRVMTSGQPHLMPNIESHYKLELPLTSLFFRW